MQEIRAEGRTVFLTTHYMEEAERLCDRVAILDGGRLVALDTSEDLIRSLGAEGRVVFTLEAAADLSFLAGLPEVSRVEQNGARVIVYGRGDRLPAAFLRLTGFEILLYLREPIAAFFTFAFAPLTLILFGSIFGNEPRPLYGGRGMVDISVPAYLGMIIATVGLISTPIAAAAGRELKVLKRFRATPLSPWIYMAAQIVTYYLVALLGGVALGICGRLLFGMGFDGNPLWVWIGFTVSTLAFISLGFLIAAVAPTARTAQAIGMILAFSLMALGGTWVPLELLPPSVRRVSEWLPLTHVVLLMRGLWAGASLDAHWTDLGVLLATLVGSGVLATRWFRWE